MNEALAALEEHFRMIFVGMGIKDTREHQAIIRAFCRADSHINVESLLEATAADGIETTTKTVQHVMSMLCEYGLAGSVQSDTGEVQYEHLHLDQHHDHLICTRCKKIINFYDDRLEELKMSAATQRRFYPFRHRLEIYGLCEDCLPVNHSTRPLIDVAVGERVRIVTMGSRRHFSRRMVDLGMIPDAEIQVVNNTGPVIVAVGTARIALGRGMASRIMVK